MNDVKLYMAPFQGITGIVFRDVFTRCFLGIDKLYTPFFTAIHKEKSMVNKASEMSMTEQNGVPVVPQILSKDADEILRFGEFCFQQGFKEINWNLGCPYPRVANKKRGSGMLPFPEMIKEILDQVVSRLKLNFSIKCRLGYSSPDEILKVVPIFNQYNIYELTIHARVGKQMYKGNVNTNAFELAGKIAKIPVVYNGDIFSVQDFNSFFKEFPDLNAWMIGRGLLADPFLPGDIKRLYHLDINERQIQVMNFVEALYLSYRKDKNDSLHILGIMKEFWSNLALSFDYPQKVFNTLKKAKSFDEYENSVKIIFEKFKWMRTNTVDKQ
jgi:tRNA-dihydrouridine synthase